LPPDNARYNDRSLVVQQTARNLPTRNSCLAMPPLFARRARSNVSTDAWPCNSASIVAVTLEKPFSGGGSGPTTATRCVDLNWAPVDAFAAVAQL
jgi:hypothetical protein